MWEVWIALIVAFALGSFAALIMQFTAVQKGAEAGASIQVARAKILHAKEKNTERRTDLRKMDKHLEFLIGQYGTYDPTKASAISLKTQIEEVRDRKLKLITAISETEKLSAGRFDQIEALGKKKALSNWWLSLSSVVVGGGTAALFGYLGLTGSEGLADIDESVTVTSYLFIQSLTLGAGWPLVWEKLFQADKLKEEVTKLTDDFNEQFEKTEVGVG